MKKLLLIFSIVFGILTFVGAGYVFTAQVGAGYAVIPMLLTLIFITAYRKQ